MKKTSKDSEHAWFRESIGAFVAGGLETTEAARFAAHKADCEACAEELEKMLTLDRKMTDLFHDAQPKVLEAGIIAHLRAHVPARPSPWPFWRRVATGFAAAVLLAVLGHEIDGLQRKGVVWHESDTVQQKDEKVASLAAEASIAHGLTVTRNTMTPNEMAISFIDKVSGKRDSNETAAAAACKAFAEAEEIYHRTDYTGDGVLKYATALSGNNSLLTNSGELALIDKSFAGAEGKPGTATPKSGYVFTIITSQGANAAGGIRNYATDAKGDMTLGYAASGEPGAYDSTGRDQFVINNNGTIFQSDQPNSATQGTASGGFGGGNGTGVGADAGAGKGSFGDRSGGRKNMVERHGGAVHENQPQGQGQGQGQVGAQSEVDQLKGDIAALKTRMSNSQGSPAHSSVDRALDNKYGPNSVVERRDDGPAQPQYFRPQDIVRVIEGNDVEKKAKDTGDSKKIEKQAGGGNAKGDGEKPAPPQPPEKPRQSYVIRNGTMEFEVDSFDSAFVQISKIVAEETGFVATTNSEKLANGKVRGSITLRVPPEHLDTLVLKLRALGELKSQNLTAQDVSKIYTDTESEIRAARAMEERLLGIIKDGKGDVSDLLKAEKELAVWREKIEKLEGEIRYYNNLISLSTLTLTLNERDIKTPTYASEQETVNAGIEAEDVESAYADALKAIADAKGRVTASELKKYEAGQFGASITCEVAPDAAGPLRDRLKQLGRLARLDVERKQLTTGGSGAPQGIKLDKKDTQFIISLYNLANVAPRETVHLNLACADTEVAYRAVLARIEKASGRVVNSNLNREKPEKTTAMLNFEIKADDADAVLSDVRATGEVMQMSMTENPDTNNVTRAKRGFALQLFALSQVAARESRTIEIAATNVADAYAKLGEAIRAAAGRVLNSRLDEKDRQDITGVLEFEVSREKSADVESALNASGDTLSNNVTRAAEAETTVDSKKRFAVTIFNAERLAPRETTTLGIELNDVDSAANSIGADAVAAGGRVIDSHVSRDRSGRVAGKVVIDVPLTAGADAVAKIRAMGIVRMIEASRNNQVPDGKLARSRIDITLANADVLVPDDKGLSSTLRGSVSTSITGLLWSLQLIVVGLCFAGPWVLIAWLVIRYVKRVRKTA